jgi:hypothetical protein
MICLLPAFASFCSADDGAAQSSSVVSNTSLTQLIETIHIKAKTFEGSAGTRLGFQTFLSTHQLDPHSIRYSDYVIVHLLFEATRDAGFWNLHWSITDQPPNSEWRKVTSVSPLKPTIGACGGIPASCPAS